MSIKPFRLALQILGGLMLLGVTVFVALRWQSLPDTLPTHFDAAGVPDGSGAKNGLIGLLATAWIMYAVFTVLSYFPQAWNIPGKSPRAYRAAGNMMPMLGLVLAGMFSWIILCSALGRGLGAWFLPVTMLAVFAPLVYMIVESTRK